MVRFKVILGSLCLAAIGDFIAVKFYPQGGSKFVWTFNQVKHILTKFHNVTHKLADTFCNKPQECKNMTDEFFGMIVDVPQELVVTFVKFIRKFTSTTPQASHDEGAVTTKHNFAAKRGAVDFTQDGAELKGNEKKAASLIKSLRFSRYEENNLCDLNEGIPQEQYDDTVDEIADLTNMPENLRRKLKRAKSFTDGNILAVNRLQFKAKDGNMVFGRVAVIRRGNVLDMAYSLNSVQYDLVLKQRQSDNGQKLESFFASLGQGDNNEEREAFEGISFELRDDLLSFFHKQAIEGFIKHCDYVLKTVTNDEVLHALGVRNDSKEVGKDDAQ